MHALDAIAVLQHGGYLNGFGSREGPLPSSPEVLNYGPVTEYVPKYTEFKFVNTAPNTVRSSGVVFGNAPSASPDRQNPLLRPPPGLSILQRSIWLIDRDIKRVKFMQQIAPRRARVFRYGADAQDTAATAAEVKRMHNVDNVYECDGIHPSLTVVCKCRSPNAVPAVDNDPLDVQLKQLTKVKSDYEKYRPFAVRVALCKQRSTEADAAAVSTEQLYRRLHYTATSTKNNVERVRWCEGHRRRIEWKPPTYYGIGNPSTGEPFFGHQFEITPQHPAEAQQRLDTAGTAADAARQAAIRAYAELETFVSESEAAAFKLVGDETAAALRMIRENCRNGLPVLSCYEKVYAHATSTLLSV